MSKFLRKALCYFNVFFLFRFTVRDPCDLHVASITKLLASGVKAAASDVSDQALKAVEKAKVCVDFDNGSYRVTVTCPECERDISWRKQTNRSWVVSNYISHLRICHPRNPKPKLDAKKRKGTQTIEEAFQKKVRAGPSTGATEQTEEALVDDPEPLPEPTPGRAESPVRDRRPADLIDAEDLELAEGEREVEAMLHGAANRAQNSHFH